MAEVSDAEVAAAEEAVRTLYATVNAERRARSQEVFGHTGASIAGCHVTLTDAVTAALKAAKDVEADGLHDHSVRV